MTSVTLELQPVATPPAEAGHYIAYDAYRQPQSAFWTPARGWRFGDGTPFRHLVAYLGPIPERDPRTGALQWPQLTRASDR